MSDRLLALRKPISLSLNRQVPKTKNIALHSAISAASLTVMMSIGVPASMAYASPVLVFVAPGPRVVKQTETWEEYSRENHTDELVNAWPYLSGQSAIRRSHECSACLMACSDHIDL